jgi:hypothetical protein
MSFATRCASTAMVTVWRKLGPKNKYGQHDFGDPYILYGTFDANLDQKYSNLGVENIPSSVFWTETSSLDPKKGDYIAKGDHTNELIPQNVNAAEIITKVDVQDCSSIGETDDIRIMT